MRSLLIVATTTAVLAACSLDEPSPASGPTAATLAPPATAEALPALVGESAPNRALACYALSTLHAQAEQSQWRPRYEKVAALWANEVLRQAGGDAATADRRRTEAVEALRSTPEAVRRAAKSSCSDVPVSDTENMAGEQLRLTQTSQDIYAEDWERPLAIADLPELIGEGAESRTVYCQVFTALQAAEGGADRRRYQPASDLWGLQNRRENDGSAESAAQFAASTTAFITTNGPPRPVLRTAADQCVAAAPPEQPDA